MTIAEFQALPESQLTGVLLALWWDGQGDWERAHTIAQDVPGQDGAWVHAYLHRKEGDLGNASYWYSRAGQPVGQGDLFDEWKDIVGEMLSRRV
ncbi:MAG: hypothetical protein PW789_05260 [Edaphobacter sp.]|uniref:hypothetical protein n=1 Tax=Edaphobacter sp. TaxID=1934404 RepID=UPI0023998B02|nr:hypothetical protein [Edaphobacter sp.]MDE1175998.1 hypothetical protein [Edaphobacter sp.]